MFTDGQITPRPSATPPTAPRQITLAHIALRPSVTPPTDLHPVPCKWMDKLCLLILHQISCSVVNPLVEGRGTREGASSLVFHISISKSLCIVECIKFSKEYC